MAEKSKVFNFTNTFFNIGMIIIHYAPGFCIYREEVKLCISCFPVSVIGLSEDFKKWQADGETVQGAPMRRSRIFAGLAAKQNPQVLRGAVPPSEGARPKPLHFPSLMICGLSDGINFRCGRNLSLSKKRKPATAFGRRLHYYIGWASFSGSLFFSWWYSGFDTSGKSQNAGRRQSGTDTSFCHDRIRINF